MEVKMEVKHLTECQNNLNVKLFDVGQFKYQMPNDMNIKRQTDVRHSNDKCQNDLNIKQFYSNMEHKLFNVRNSDVDLNIKLLDFRHSNVEFKTV